MENVLIYAKQYTLKSLESLDVTVLRRTKFLLASENFFY